MPTKPIDDLVPREIPSEIQIILGQLADLVDELVNFGSHVFAWSAGQKLKGDEHAPILLTFRHILELLDTIAVLLRSSCLDPCKLVLRALFECTLTIEFIFKNKTEQRGKDFLIWYEYRKLNFYRRHNPKDELYKQFSSEISKDRLGKRIAIVEIPNIEQEIEAIRATIDHPSFSESKAEYERYKKEKGTPRYWYNLHDGPKDIEQLAKLLKKNAFYETLYRHWSDFTHGTDILRNKLSISEAGEVSFSQIRLPIDSESTTSLAISFASETFDLFIRKYTPDKMGDMKIWYKREIRDRYLQLSGRPLIVIK